MVVVAYLNDNLLIFLVALPADLSLLIFLLSQTGPRQNPDLAARVPEHFDEVAAE